MLSPGGIPGKGQRQPQGIIQTRVRRPGDIRAELSVATMDGVQPRFTLPLVCAVFFVSGGAALVYQVVWQRALFAIYGVNVESVTLVVTAFLLGLGLGSLLGGVLSRKGGRTLLFLFAVFELLIGLYGLASLSVFAAVGRLTAGGPLAATFLWAFTLVVLPTGLMGATLPLLSAWTVRRIGNVGRAVSVLYFVNTLGSAASAALTATWLLGALGQRGTVAVAAVANGLVGGSVLLLRRRAPSDS